LGEVIPFRKKKSPEKHKGSILCKRGFHKWKVDNEKQFDSKQGRLITAYTCKRCGKTKTEAVS